LISNLPKARLCQGTVGNSYVTAKLSSKGNEPFNSFNLRATFLQDLRVSNPSKFGSHLSLAYIDPIEMQKGEGKNYLNRLSSRITMVNNNSQVQLTYFGAPHTSFTVGEVWIVWWSNIFKYNVLQRIPIVYPQFRRLESEPAT
jgi:hypothetical protein